MKHLLLFILLAFNLSIGISQDYPDYSIEALDEVFKIRLNEIQKDDTDKTSAVVIDTCVINLAKKGVYIPTSINLYFDNVDSLLNVTKDSIDPKKREFISHLKYNGIASLSEQYLQESESFFAEISTDENLRLCFYAVYDLEMAANNREVIIVDWKKDGRVFYSPESDPLIFKKLNTLAVNSITENCNYGTGNFRLFSVKNNGEVYPKNKLKGQYRRFYLNDYLSWDIIGEMHAVIDEIDSKQDFKVVYSSLSFFCSTTVECPQKNRKNPFSGSSGSAGK